MTLEARLLALVQAIGADIKALLARAVPTSGAAGQVLTRTGPGATDYAWANVAGGGGGAAAVHSVVLDFGSAGLLGKTFTFAAPLATTASKVVVSVAGPADGRPQDELEMDGLDCAAVCLTNGTLTVSARANPGPVSGQYTIHYILG